jgi:nucleotide-binding universal stress UspA family protein
MESMPVVVGVDGSEESLRAAEWAAREAQRHRVPLRIVSAPAMPPRMHAYDTVPQTVASALRTRAAGALGEAVGRAGEVTSGLLVEADLLTGIPALAVTDCGTDARMLVVGARGVGGFAAMLLGSISRYVSMHAACPVVVAQEETSAAHLEVVVGVRDPHDTADTLGFAFEEADLRHATLVAVHSRWLPAAVGGLAGDGPGHSAHREQALDEASSALSKALDGWRDKYPAVPVRLDVVNDHPAKVLACYSSRADLVVIGRHGAPGRHPAIGAIQHAVLNHAHGPVAMVPSRVLGRAQTSSSRPVA